MLRSIVFSATLVLFSFTGSAQTPSENSDPSTKWNYQIYLKQPAKEIKELSYFTDCKPATGWLAQDGKTIIIKDYHQKGCIYVKVIYQDGSEDEFIRSSCFIDPVI